MDCFSTTMSQKMDDNLNTGRQVPIFSYFSQHIFLIFQQFPPIFADSLESAN